MLSYDAFGHKQVDPQVKQFAKDMLVHGHFTFICNKSNSEGALAHDLGSIPNKEAPAKPAERFDLTGTDEDNDDNEA